MALNEHGVPEAQVIIYAFSRGAYDDHLWELEQAIKRRRQARREIGDLVMSRGDRLELIDSIPKYPVLESAIVRVARIPSDRRKITVKIEKTQMSTHYLGKVISIPRNWVFYPAREE